MGAAYREELSANARKLIEQLLSLPQGWVTAATLAESIGVSRRTVLRELPAVEQWMQAAGAHFVRNPGKGLLLDELPEQRDALRTRLNSGDKKELSRAERRQQLLTRLLREQEPCKTAALARELGVSESTLSADLDELETKLHPYRVEMFRRPGVGVWLQGDASSYRRVVSALLRSSLPEKELAEVLFGRMPENTIFSTLLDTKTAEKVWKVLQQFEQEEQLHLPDAGFLALAIHCTLTIQQLQQGGDKGSAPRGLRPAGNHAARLVAALQGFDTPTNVCPAGGGAEPRLRADSAARGSAVSGTVSRRLSGRGGPLGQRTGDGVAESGSCPHPGNGKGTAHRPFRVHLPAG